MASASARDWPKFVIYQKGATSSVWMDGEQLQGVTDVTVKMGVGIKGIAQVTITFFSTSVNEDTAALIKLMKEPT